MDADCGTVATTPFEYIYIMSIQYGYSSIGNNAYETDRPTMPHDNKLEEHDTGWGANIQYNFI
jgi:hypothetical protein